MRRLAFSCLVVVGCSSMAKSSGDMNGGASDMNGTGDMTAGGPMLVSNLPFDSNVLLDISESETIVTAVFGTHANTQKGPCFNEVIGSCTIFDCERDDGGAQLPQREFTTVAAGTITVSGFGMPFIVQPPSNSPYTYSGVDAAVWSGGETLTVAATGGDVPAFSVSLRAPKHPTVFTPTSSNGPVTVTRAAGFTVTWASAALADARLELSPALDASNPKYDGLPSVTCVVPADTGRLTVPAAVLERLPNLVYAYMKTLTRTTKMVGEWPINVTAMAELNDDSSGALWTATLILQ